MSTIKVGDRVRVSDTPDVGAYTGNGDALYWNSSMNRYKGEIGECIGGFVGSLCVKFANGDYWHFLPADLTLAPAEATLPTAHVHAASMLLYAQDAAETDKPWLRWQHQNVAETEWFQVDRHPGWRSDVVYRRKPITIRVGEFDVPEPLRVAPAVGTTYFMPELESEQLSGFSSWSNDELDFRWMSRGLCHLTREAANLHAKALLSFTAGTRKEPA